MFTHNSRKNNDEKQNFFVSNKILNKYNVANDKPKH